MLGLVFWFILLQILDEDHRSSYFATEFCHLRFRWENGDQIDEKINESGE